MHLNRLLLSSLVCACGILPAAEIPAVNTAKTPAGSFIIAPGAEWREYAKPPVVMRKAGTVLDLSGYADTRPSGAHGRLIVGKNGHFVFADAPDKPVRFLCAACQPRFPDHQAVDAYVGQLRICGYNMVRTHFLDNLLMFNSAKTLEFNPEVWDNFQYLFAKLKENGIYWNFDCMTSWDGYFPGNIWAAGKDRNHFKAEIYFNPEIRRHWLEGVKKILCSENPYTRTRMIDEPLLALSVAFNEQEFSFIRPGPKEMMLPRWQEFLQKRYGTIEKWQEAHPRDKAQTFAEIPLFRNGRVNQDNDVAAFVTDLENSLFAWYRDELRKIGFKGLLTNYNMCKDQRYSYLHNQMDYVAMNSYHCHPYPVGKHIGQYSSLAKFVDSFRGFLGTRIADKPFVVTEHNHVFWNKYRYEQGLVIGGYGAFSDFDVLTVHASPVGPSRDTVMRSFGTASDPVGVASEFLTWCAFIRGDVRPADNHVRVVVNPATLVDSAKARQAIAGAQTKLGLLGRFALEYAADAAALPPLGKNDLRLSRQGGAQVVNNTAGFAAAVDAADNLEKQVSLMKQNGILPAGNRSDGKNIFETSTGEIYLDASRNYLSVNTPRLQGICGEKGATAQLADFEVLALAERGCLALAAMDGMKSLKDAERMVLVYTTNALNNGDEFTSESMEDRIKEGRKGCLVKNGGFTVAIRHPQSDALKCHVLQPDGTRMNAIAPDKVADGKVYFTVDTSKLTGAGVFFEIAR